MDFSKNPCDDFFHYACGKWIKKNPIPEDKSGIDAITKVGESVNQDMLVLLQDSKETHNSSSIRVTKEFFKKCMDTKSIESMKSRPIHNFIKSLGGWPLLDKDWKSIKIDFTDLLVRMKKEFGVDLFFGSDVVPDQRNISNHVVTIDQGALGLGRGARDYYLNETAYEKQIKAFKQKIVDFAHLIADDLQLKKVDEDHLKKSVEKMFNFEQKIANITVPEENKHNWTEMYNRWTLNELGKTFKRLDWPDYYEKLVPSEVYSRLIRSQTNKFPVIVAVPKFFKELDDLLSAADPKDLINYIIWTVVHATSGFFDERYEDAAQKFEALFSGRQQKKPRWKRCISAVQMMDMAIGAMYVREHFTVGDKAAALTMIKYLKIAFNAILGKIDWMDQATRDIAVEKIKFIIDQVGFPDFVMNDATLDDYYKNLTVSSKDLGFFDMAVTIETWYRNKAFFDLLQNVDRYKFSINPAMVNAFYGPDKNIITFPAGILHPPFFDGSYPNYINFGAIGAVIGHEMTHGFDDQGSQFDKIGALTNWWSQTAAEKFDKKKQCMINQYSDFIVSDIQMHVNGKLTQSENIADNGGLKQAFLAYIEYTRINGPEPKLPGLSLTNEQAFFASFSQLWCEDRKKGAKILRLLIDPHSPNIFRVNGAVLNSPDFARVFNCPLGSPMNPRKKCEVW